MKDIDIAKETLLAENLTLVIVKNQQIIHKSNAKGVKSLVQITKETPEMLYQSSIADTVIGKAAAMLYVHGEVSEVYSVLISKPAIDLFDSNDIDYHFNKQTELIQNTSRTSLCPMEKIALVSDDVPRLLHGIEDFFEQMQKNK